MRARDGDFLGKVDVEFVLEGVQFVLEFFLNFCQRVRHKLSAVKKNYAEPSSAGLRAHIIDREEMEGQGQGTERGPHADNAL